MLREEIIAHLGGDWELLNKYISDALRTDIHLLQAVNKDIISHGGKMLRPIVSILSARMINNGVANDESIRVAASIELLHNATLLHDDVADESPTRRGLPTLCSLLGSSSAVLVGDFWLARAMELSLSSAKRSEMAKIYSKAMTNLAEGEMLQLQKAWGEGTDIEDYFRIIYCKTASLFETACMGVALANDADEKIQSGLRDYAVSLGIAFQIKDDILDYTGDISLGKPVGIDLKEQKVTLPLLCCFDDKGKEREIRNKIADIHDHPEYCEQIRTFVLEEGGDRKAGVILNDYVQKALSALCALPSGKDRDYLMRIAEYNTIRKV